jgi:uncharacterized membrane protein
LIANENSNHQLSWPWWRFILTGLNSLALVLSAVLSWHYLQGGSIIGCNGGSACDQVLNSQWSTIAGVLPVSGLAMGVYLAFLIAGFFIGPVTEAPIRLLAWNAMLILAGAVAGSAVWFIILQKWIIGDFCIFCMSTHITGLLLTIMVIWRAIKEFENPSSNISRKNLSKVQSISPKASRSINRIMSKPLIGFMLACIMAAFQVIFAQQSAYSDGESRDKLPVINYHDAPIVGSPDAPYVVTLLFDYKCPHCQQIHLLLDEAIRRYNGKLAFVLCPTPLNTQCNPYIPRDVDEFKNSCELAKIGLAVWLAKREAFPAFDNWMYFYESGDMWHPRSLESTVSKAVELVGQEKFDAARENPWIKEYMQTCIRIYGQTILNGKGGIPRLIFGSHFIIIKPGNAEDVIAILQKSLGVPKP